MTLHNNNEDENDRINALDDIETKLHDDSILSNPIHNIEEDSDDDVALLESLKEDREPVVLEGIARKVAEEFAASKNIESSTRICSDTHKTNSQITGNPDWKEEYSGLRMKDRIVSRSDLASTMTNKTFIPLDRISKESIGKIKGDWICVAVLGESYKSKVNKRGEKYDEWPLLDLKMPLMTKIPLHLYGFAAAKLKHDKIGAGHIVKLTSPSIMQSEGGRPVLVVKLDTDIIPLGRSLDFGFCNKSLINGNRCRNITNTGLSSMCPDHMDQVLQTCKVDRMALNSHIGPKVSLNKSKPQINASKPILKSNLVSKFLEDKRQQSEPSAQGKVISKVMTKDGRVILGTAPNPETKKKNLAKSLNAMVGVSGTALPASMSTKGFQQVFAVATGKNLAQMRQQENLKRARALAASDASSAKRRQLSQGSTNPRQAPTGPITKSPIPSLSLEEYKKLLAASQKAGENNKLKSASELRMERVKMSEMRADLLSGSAMSTPKPSLLGTQSIPKPSAMGTPSIPKPKPNIASTTSIRPKSRFDDLAIQKQHQTIQSKLKFLGEQEKECERKMKIQSIDVSAFFCTECHKITETKTDTCVAQAHTFSALPKVKKSFFKCKRCGFRTSMLGNTSSRLMKPCNGCGGINYEACSAYSDKTLGIPQFKDQQHKEDLMINSRGPASTFNTRSAT